MRFPVRFGVRLAAITFVLAGAAYAQLGEKAILNAIIYRPIPSGQPIYVRSLDDSRETLALKREFETALAARGFHIDAAPSRLVLTLEPSDQIGFWNYNSGALINAQRGYNSLARKDLDSYMVNLYDSRRGGLINQPERPSGVNPSKYRLEARLEDRTDGRTLWQGWTTASLDRGDGQTLLQAMVAPLAASVGQTVREQPVTLR